MSDQFQVSGHSDDLITVDGEELYGGTKTFRFTTPKGEVIQGVLEYDGGGWAVTLPRKEGTKVRYWDSHDQEWKEAKP